MSIGTNIEQVEDRIQRACDRSGRKRDEIKLVCVSKFQGLNAIDQALKAGIQIFGESRIQEGIEKFSVFRAGHTQVQIHFIGNLQSNKAKKAAGFFDCIQSVDRFSLIQELGKAADFRNKEIVILLELHTGEATKSGFPDIDSLCRAAELCLEYRSVNLQGLMTMAPFTENEQEIRASFRTLYKAGAVLKQRFGEQVSCLSMGMSNDFEIAIEEGSTMLRIGTAIFDNKE